MSRSLISLPESTFTFGEHPVRTVIRDGEPWFVAADVCALLGYRKPADALRHIEPDEYLVLPQVRPRAHFLRPRVEPAAEHQPGRREQATRSRSGAVPVMVARVRYDEHTRDIDQALLTAIEAEARTRRGFAWSLAGLVFASIAAAIVGRAMGGVVIMCAGVGLVAYAFGQWAASSRWASSIRGLHGATRADMDQAHLPMARE